jgi:hypothetical protein
VSSPGPAVGISWIVLRIAVGAFIVLGALFLGWLAKFLLFPAVVVIVAGVVFFMVGDLVVYLMANWSVIWPKFVEACRGKISVS